MTGPIGFDPDGTPIYPTTVGQLGLCGPRSDDPEMGPDAARHRPLPDDEFGQPGPGLVKQILAACWTDMDEADLPGPMSGDGFYDDVSQLIGEHDYRGLVAAANTMGLVGDWGVDDVEEALVEAMHEYRSLRAALAGRDATIARVRALAEEWGRSARARRETVAVGSTAFARECALIEAYDVFADALSGTTDAGVTQRSGVTQPVTQAEADELASWGAIYHQCIDDGLDNDTAEDVATAELAAMPGTTETGSSAWLAPDVWWHPTDQLYMHADIPVHRLGDGMPPDGAILLTSRRSVPAGTTDTPPAPRHSTHHVYDDQDRPTGLRRCSCGESWNDDVPGSLHCPKVRTSLGYPAADTPTTEESSRA